MQRLFVVECRRKRQNLTRLRRFKTFNKLKTATCYYPNLLRSKRRAYCTERICEAYHSQRPWKLIMEESGWVGARSPKELFAKFANILALSILHSSIENMSSQSPFDLATSASSSANSLRWRLDFVSSWLLQWRWFSCSWSWRSLIGIAVILGIHLLVLQGVFNSSKYGHKVLEKMFGAHQPSPPPLIVSAIIEGIDKSFRLSIAVRLVWRKSHVLYCIFKH